MHNTHATPAAVQTEGVCPKVAFVRVTVYIGARSTAKSSICQKPLEDEAVYSAQELERGLRPWEGAESSEGQPNCCWV